MNDAAAELASVFDYLPPPPEVVETEAPRQLTPEQLRNQLMEELADAELEVERRRLRKNLYPFVEKFWNVVEPQTEFRSNWHIVELCKILEEVEDGLIGKLIVNVPPGTMKSLLINVMFPAWLWARNPGIRVLSASYGAQLATRDNIRVRNIITSKEFQALFPVQLLPDQNTKTRYNTDQGGWRIATSVNGVATGEHPDYILIDDPLSAAQAESEIERKAANDWIDGTLSTRGVSRGARQILVMQRLHQEDPTGHLLAKGGWTHVCWPMEYEVERKNDKSYKPDPRDPRTTPGELLWPNLFSADKVAALRIALGEYGAAGQLQQNPAPEGGGLFKREWFKFVDRLPANITRQVRGWDTAATKDGGDYTVGTRMAEDDQERVYIAHVIRGQWSPAGVDMVMKTTAQSDGVDVPVREEKEVAAAGKAVTDARSKLLKGFDYTFVQVSGDKATRARPFRAYAEAGNVYLVRGEWNEAWLDELTNFPTAKYDDQVDSASTAFNSLMLEEVKGGVLAGKATW